MATNQAAAGMDHPTVVPENFDPERCGPDAADDRNDAGAADEPDRSTERFERDDEPI